MKTWGTYEQAAFARPVLIKNRGTKTLSELSLARLQQTMGTQRLEDPWMQSLCFNHFAVLPR